MTEYILSGDPGEVEKVIRENRIRIERGLITVTPRPVTEAEPAEADTKGVADTDTKEVEAVDAKEAEAGDTKEVAVDSDRKKTATKTKKK